MSNYTSMCPWPLFDEQESDDIVDQLHYIGGLSALIFIGLLLAYIHPTFETNRSYQNIGFFMLSAWIRRCTPFLMAYIIDKKDIYRREMTLCRLFGFLETFMAIHEVECLTHVCIERYVVSKYITNGWRMPDRHYYMFRLLSVLFAGTYSLAAVSGLIGSYGYDFTCSSCTMDMILPGGWQKYSVSLLFIARSIKPVGFMILMLRWAKQLESKFVDFAYNRQQKQITNEVIVLTAVNLACWAPIALIQASVILSQHLFGPGEFSLPSSSLVKMALLMHWSSLGCSTINLFLLNPNIRKAAINFRFQNFSELTSDPQKTE
ncbi:rhodopsin-like [Cydia fagiglandana]|uniref:rhodopsin-like n=1 Tax=Cydia fagiglandana TaxID=1458189 RepID=UPI002FEE09D9